MESLPPVADLDGIGFCLGAADDHFAVGDQLVHGLIGAVVAEQDGDVLAELGPLAVIAAQLAGAQAEAEGAEGATGIDGGQLPVVADHDHLASGPIGHSPGAGRACGCRPWLPHQLPPRCDDRAVRTLAGADPAGCRSWGWARWSRVPARGRP